MIIWIYDIRVDLLNQINRIFKTNWRHLLNKKKPQGLAMQKEIGKLVLGNANQECGAIFEIWLHNFLKKPDSPTVLLEARMLKLIRA